MTKIDWGKIHEHYYNAYKEIFKYLDFSQKAARFMEENQVVNFCEAVKAEYSGTICWYEYPWKPKNGDSKRFDAVLYIPQKDALLVLEAKCLRHSKKYSAMTNDLKRVLDEDNTKQIMLDNKLSNSKKYVVILADYWDKGEKNNVHKTHKEWKEHSMQGLLSEFIAEVNKNVKDPLWTVSPSKSFFPYDSYYLLSMIGEI